MTYKAGDGVMVRDDLAAYKFARIVRDDRDLFYVEIDREVNSRQFFARCRLQPAPSIKVGDWVRIKSEQPCWAGIRKVERVYEEKHGYAGSVKVISDYGVDGLFEPHDFEPVYDYTPPDAADGAQGRQYANSSPFIYDSEKPSPIRTITRREIVPGMYGDISVVYTENGKVSIRLEPADFTAFDLREAAHFFNQLAEVLEDNDA